MKTNFILAFVIINFVLLLGIFGFASGVFPKFDLNNSDNDSNNNQDNDSDDDDNEPKETQISYFLVNRPDDFDPNEYEKYYVKIDTDIKLQDASTEDSIDRALSELFEIKEFKNSISGNQNFLYESDLSVDSITLVDGKHIINLKGRVFGIGTLADLFIKPQVEKTIEIYTNNYEIRLNSSESEWRCSLDMSGLCE